MPGYTDILDELGFSILDESSGIVLDENDVLYPAAVSGDAWATNPAVLQGDGPVLTAGIAIAAADAIPPAVIRGPVCYTPDCTANRIDYPLHAEHDTELTLCVSHTWLSRIHCT